MWSSGPDDVWVMAGKLHHWDGASWTSMAVPDPYYRIWGARRDLVWAVTNKGGIVRWDGATWTKIADPPPGLELPLGPDGPVGFANGDAWLPLETFGVCRWNGSSWKSYRLPTPQIGAWVRAVRGFDANDVWAYTAGGGMFHFEP